MKNRIEEAAMLHGGNTDKEKLDWLIEHASKVEADLTRQLEEEKGGYRMAIDMLAEERKRVKEKEAQLANQRQYTEDHLLTIEGLRSQLAEAKKIFPIEVHGWKIEPEGEPWALKYNFGPLRASNDGEVINGTLGEILTAIVGQTPEYREGVLYGVKLPEFPDSYGRHIGEVNEEYRKALAQARRDALPFEELAELVKKNPSCGKDQDHNWSRTASPGIQYCLKCGRRRKYKHKK